MSSPASLEKARSLSRPFSQRKKVSSCAISSGPPDASSATRGVSRDTFSTRALISIFRMVMGTFLISAVTFPWLRRSQQGPCRNVTAEIRNVPITSALLPEPHSAGAPGYLVGAQGCVHGEPPRAMCPEIEPDHHQASGGKDAAHAARVVDHDDGHGEMDGA